MMVAPDRYDDRGGGALEWRATTRQRPSCFTHTSVMSPSPSHSLPSMVAYWLHHDCITAHCSP
jgi:hypothetical protein